MHLTSTRYAFWSAFLKGEESRGITRHHLDEMLKKSTFQDALDVIRNTDLGDYLGKQPLGIFDDADHRLWTYLGESSDRMKQLAPPLDMLHLMDRYMRKFDVLNIKIGLRSLFVGETAPMTPLGLIYQAGVLKEFSKAQSVDEMAKVLANCHLEDYAFILKNIKENDGLIWIRNKIND